MESNAYFGGKSGSGTYQTIINQIPPHRVYVELFGGMLGIYRHKRPAQLNILIEKDSDLVQSWEEKFGLKPNFGKYALFNFANNKQATGSWSYPGCALELFEHSASYSAFNKEDVFIYVDPPYPLETRSSSTRYKHDLTDEQHKELLETLISIPDAKIALSTYPNDFYYDFFEGRKEWRFIEFESQTRHGRAIEQLWMNYPEPVELHDYQYLGDNYRERERIGRKLNRWEAKFRDLAPLEQAAMIQRLTVVMDPIGVIGGGIS